MYLLEHLIYSILFSFLNNMIKKVSKDLKVVPYRSPVHLNCTAKFRKLYWNFFAQTVNTITTYLNTYSIKNTVQRSNQKICY